MTNTVPFHRFVIVGAGLGGLMLARLLQLQGIDVVVFERSAGRDVQQQGGSLDMHAESGQRALRAAGLAAGFLAIARPEGQGMRIADKQGRVLWDEVGSSEVLGRPEVDRPALRNLLLNSLAPGTVRWGHALSEIEPLPQGGHSLRFANGQQVATGMLVGADGAWSKVRPLLTPALPCSTGVRFIEISLVDADRAFPELAQMVAMGSFFALADRQGLLAQRNGDGQIRVYAAFRSSEGSPGSRIGQGSPVQIRASLLRLFEGWAPSLRALIEAGDEHMLVRDIHRLPVGLRWPTRPGVTLIGDAAHLMSPFAGEGANLALLDALELAHSLATGVDDNAAIQAYESGMFERAHMAAQASADNLDLFFCDDAALQMTRLMASFVQQADG